METQRDCAAAAPTLQQDARVSDRRQREERQRCQGCERGEACHSEVSGLSAPVRARKRKYEHNIFLRRELLVSHV